MRIRTLAIGLCLAASAVALAAPPKSSVSAAFPKTVFLGGTADLDHLRVTNPRHYVRVERILARADQICSAGKPQLLALEFDAEDFACFRSFVYTSYPPQRQLSFRIDQTRYIAMVFLKEAEGKLTPAEQTSTPGATGSRPHP